MSLKDTLEEVARQAPQRHMAQFMHTPVVVQLGGAKVLGDYDRFDGEKVYVKKGSVELSFDISAVCSIEVDRDEEERRERARFSVKRSTPPAGCVWSTDGDARLVRVAPSDPYKSGCH